jgi:hypothetical protein
MKRIRIFYGLLSFLTLVSGMGIYLLFRDMSNMIIFTWFPKNELFETVFIQIEQPIISYIVKFNLPDMLWFVSGIMLFRFIWFYKFREQKIYVRSFYILGAAFEISQLSKNIPGTFDWFDLLFMGMGAFVECLLYNFFIGRRIGWKTEKGRCILFQ